MPFRNLALAAFPLIVAGCISQPNVPPNVPDNLRVTGAEVPLMTLAARGAQIYECREKAGDAKTMEWTFIAPEADLFDGSGREVGTHFAGPSWQGFDGSKIVGTVKASAVGPRAGAISWLWLTARNVGPDGLLSKVTSVQRINTYGGTAPPALTCTPESRGTQRRVAYTADYVMFRAK